MPEFWQKNRFLQASGSVEDYQDVVNLAEVPGHVFRSIISPCATGLTMSQRVVQSVVESMRPGSSRAPETVELEATARKIVSDGLRRSHDERGRHVRRRSTGSAKKKRPRSDNVAPRTRIWPGRGSGAA